MSTDGGATVHPEERAGDSADIKSELDGAAASLPSAELRAIPIGDVDELLDSARPAPVELGDESMIEGDDSNLDPDRYDDPEGRDPLRAGQNDDVGRRGRLLAELFVVDGKPTYRLLDVSGRAPAPGARRLSPREAHDIYLDLLATVLLSTQRAAVFARDEADGRANLVRFTATELAQQVKELLNDRKAAGALVPLKFDRSFVSRILTDRIRFPWGEVEVGDIARGNRGKVSDDQLVRGWKAVAPLLLDGADARVAGDALAACWRRASGDNAKYVRDFRVIVGAWDVIDALAFNAVDGGHLRAALEARGIVLEKAWLYDALGLLDRPDSAEV